VKVSNIEAGDDSLSFDVDRPGVPVLVKTSYFPNWRASGAEGPYRATPNLMVVIPTSNHVELHYGLSAMELFAYLLSLLGVAGLVLIFRLQPLDRRPVTAFWAPVEDPDRATPSLPEIEELPVPSAGVPGGANGAKVDLVKRGRAPDEQTEEEPAEPEAPPPIP
jgi:hypothetical protein